MEVKLYKKKTFVLVHGTWFGGWCWRDVAGMLEARGCKVFTPTLTGLGERSHLLSNRISLDTHIADVVNLFEWEDLHDVTLVGHSSGGWPISGAVEQVLSRVSAIVYLDAFFPEDGQTPLDTQAPEARAKIEAAIADGKIGREPGVTDALDVADAATAAWINRHATAHPYGIYTSRINLTGARELVTKKLYVRAKGYPNTRFDRYLSERQADPSWLTMEMTCGHNVMIERPAELCDLLLDI